MEVTLLCQLLSQYRICEELFSASGFHPTITDSQKLYRNTSVPQMIPGKLQGGAGEMLGWSSRWEWGLKHPLVTEG